MDETQTVKTQINGQPHYRKPSRAEGETPYKPLRKNKNSWYFLNRKDPCKEVWEMGQRYYLPYQKALETGDKSKLPRRRAKSPVALVKLLYWVYLTGARQQEAFRRPYPTISIVNKEGETRVISTHLNQKQKKKDDRVVAVMPVFDEYEQKMWNFITDGGEETQAERIFMYKEWRSTNGDNISKLFKRAFKTSLINSEDPEEKVHRNEGITPHILRHMRSYNVLINHGMQRERELVKLWFGWKSDSMLDYYPHIRVMLAMEAQEDMLRKAGLLTDLKINDNKILTSIKGPG